MATGTNVYQCKYCGRTETRPASMGKPQTGGGCPARPPSNTQHGINKPHVWTLIEKRK